MKWNKLNERLQVSHYTCFLNETYITQKWRLRSARTNGNKSWIKLKEFLQPQVTRQEHLRQTENRSSRTRCLSWTDWPTCYMCVVSGSIPGVLKRPWAKQQRPDEQVAASHGRSAAVGVWVCLCAWVNAQYCKVLFGALCTKAQYKCSPCAIYHDPTSHSDYYISCTLTMLSALLGGTWTAGTCGGKCVHSTTRIGGGDLPSERRLSTQSPEILSRVGSASDRRGFQGQKTSDFYNPQILPPGLFLEQYVSNCCSIFRSFIGSK